MLTFIPSHGSVDSTPVALLEILNPQYVITPAGNRSNFGHPREFLDTL
jgi:beta-lactamase superfamily II metal-dependent hydrolase